MNKMYETLMPVIAMEKTTTGGTSHATETFKLDEFRRALFYVFLEAGDGEYIVNHTTHHEMELTLIERKGLDGAVQNLREDIGFKAGQGTRKMKAENVNDWDNDSALTIDGVAFTKKAAKDDAENQFTDGDELAAQINAEFDHITASDSTNDVTVVVDDFTDSMDVELSMEGTTAVNRVSFLESAALVEVHVSELSADYDSVHLNVDGSDAGDPSSTVVVVLGNAYVAPVEQPVAVTS